MGVQRLLACWGNAASGRLGLGYPLTSQMFPRIVGSVVGYNIKQVACGGNHTVVLADDGTVLTFGDNVRGQLGHSKDDKEVGVPLEVGLPDPVEAVAAGNQHTLCLTRSGEVWAFGNNANGELGIGATAKEPRQVEPRLVKALQGAGVVAVAAGFYHSLALTARGEVYSWGYGEQGALGHGPVGVGMGQPQPRLVRSLSGIMVQSITAGYYSSGCLDSQRRVYTWGHGRNHQLGHGAGQHEFFPKMVAPLRNVTSLALGHSHSMASTGDGRLFIWGTDDHGCLGQGEGHWQKLPIYEPKPLGSTPRVGQVAVGFRHSAVVTTEGLLYTWGFNGAEMGSSWGMDMGSGQLGHGDERDRWAPKQVLRLMTSKEKFYDLRMSYIKPWKVQQVACGRNHTAMVVESEINYKDLL